jgi:hypothetical protein
MSFDLQSSVLKGTRRHLLAASLACAALLTGCADPLPEPPVRTLGTFGEEAFRFLRAELARSGTPEEGATRAETLDDHRPGLVADLDHAVSGRVKTDLLAVLEAWLPLYAPEAVALGAAIPALTRDLADLLDLVVADAPLRDALAGAGSRARAYPNALVSLIGAVARHPRSLGGDLLTLAKALEPQLTELFRYLALELPTLTPDGPRRPGERTLLGRMADLTLTPGSTPMGPPAWAVRLDDRGAMRLDPAWAGAMPHGFSDADADGQPDLDPRGRLVGPDGTPVEVAPFAARSQVAGVTHDSHGRAVSGSLFIYDYVDLRTSALAFLLRDARRLLARGGHLDLFTAAEALIGPRVDRSDADGAYQGHDVSRAPLLDVAHAVNALRAYPRLLPLMRSFAFLVRDREVLLRNLVSELAHARAITAEAGDVEGWLNFLADATPVLDRLARHGGLRALVASATHPATADLVPAFRTMLRHSGLNLPADMDVLARPSDVDALTFRDATPWDVPDTYDSDRSWLHKCFLLIADTAGAPAFLKLLDQFDVRELVITDDMATFYIDAIAGQAELDLGSAVLEQLAVTTAAEFDDTALSAEELNLFMNHDQVLLGNPVGLQGIPVRERYGPALLALQASGGLDALRPWVTRVVEAGHGDDIVAIFQLLAAHWGETAYEVPGLWARGTGLRVLEPTVVRLLEETRLAPLLIELAAWADGATFEADGETLNVADEVDAFLRWWVAPSGDARTRDGQDVLRLATGDLVSPPSRLQLLMHALGDLDDALDAAPEARAAWDRADVLGLFLDLAPDGTLANAHLLDLLVALAPVLADAVAEDVARPEYLGELEEVTPDLEAFAGSRGFAAIVAAMRRVRDEAPLRALADGLLVAMLEEEPPAAAEGETARADLFGGLLRLAVSAIHDAALHDALTPVLRFVGRALDPERRRVMRAVDSVLAMRASDPGRVGDALVANLFDEPEVQRFPWLTVMDAFEAVLREDPRLGRGGAAPLTAGDLGAIAGRVRDFLRDERTGMERVYRIILSR